MRWQEFVGTGELLKSLEAKVGRFRDRMVNAIKGKPAQAERVTVAVESSLETLIVEHAEAAAERAEASWESLAPGHQLLTDVGEDLGRASRGLRRKAERAVRDWQQDVLDMVRTEGADKRTTARFLAYGVNGLSVALMVVVFAQTAGLTGAEVGIAGGGAVLGQKLLEAVFGDQAVRTLVRARPAQARGADPGAARGGASALHSTWSSASASTPPPPTASATPPVRSTTSGTPPPERPGRTPTRLVPVRGWGLSKGRRCRPCWKGPRGSCLGAPNSVTGSRVWSRPAEAARGRLDDHVVDDVQAAVARVATRLGLTADHTVVALAGATGSGKSSTFNALAGVELSSVGVRRPTTSWATACVWGKEGADELLDYLDIAPRHQVMRDSLLDLGKEDSALQGVVLLDLPDHDSTEVSHHLEVDRLIELADLMVWVLDPQKYADAAVHDRYLAPLATHQDVMLVVLNHIDEVPVDRRESMMADVRRLVDADGLIGVPVLATSARTGRGHRRAARRDRAPGQGQEGHPGAARGRRPPGRRAPAARPAAPAPTRSCRRRGSRRSTTPSPRLPASRPSSTPSSRPPGCAPTGPPAGRSPPGCRGSAPTRSSGSTSTSARTASSTPAAARTSVPGPTQVQRAGVDSEVRAVADEVSAPLARPWAESVRRASVSRLPDLNDRLDSALAGHRPRCRPDPGLGRAGAGAPVAAAARRDRRRRLARRARHRPLPRRLRAVHARRGRLPGADRDAPRRDRRSGSCCRCCVGSWSRRRPARGRARPTVGCASAITEVADDLVVAPVRAELAAYDQVREGLGRALK